MNPTKHKTCNAVLGAPADWDHDKLPCDALAINRCEMDGLPVVQSFWRPDAEELEALNAGGLVCLGVIGRNMPPVMVAVTPAEPVEAAH